MSSAFLRWAGVNLLIGQLGQLLRHAGELLPLQLRACRRRARLHGRPLLHLHPVGLRQQLRDRLLRHRMAGHRSGGLALEHPRLLRRPEHVADPAGAQPARQPRFPQLLPRLPRLPPRHRVHPGGDRRADRRRRSRRAVAAGVAGGVSRVRHAVRRAVHRTAVRPTTRCTAPGADSTSCPTATTQIYGIVHYVRMRHDRAREQLARLRRHLPAGAGGGHFPAALEPLPARP